MTGRAARNPLGPMIAAVHVEAKRRGIDDDARRELMDRLTGKTSSKDMTAAELGRVLDAMKGGSSRSAPERSSARRPADHPVARKARALWLSLHSLGVVTNPNPEALEAFACRQLGVEVFQWADQGRGYKLIEALKAMAERAGWSQDTTGLKGEAAVAVLKARLQTLIAERQAAQ